MVIDGSVAKKQFIASTSCSAPPRLHVPYRSKKHAIYGKMPLGSLGINLACYPILITMSLSPKLSYQEDSL